jgi:hypothetical protein
MALESSVGISIDCDHTYSIFDARVHRLSRWGGQGSLLVMRTLLRHGLFGLALFVALNTATIASRYLDTPSAMTSSAKIISAPISPRPTTAHPRLLGARAMPPSSPNSFGALMPIRVASLAVPSDLESIEVPAGCARWEKQENFHSFYVDPANGSMKNDGSASAPWSTLEAVVAANLFYDARKNSSAPIHPGDVIYLRSGDHGSPRFYGIVNSNFVRVKAEPGQVPTVENLEANGVAKFIFQGLTFANTSNKILARIDQTSQFGESKDLVFIDNTLYAKSNVSSWTQADWAHDAPFAGFLTAGSCISILNNRFSNLKNGMQIYSDDTIVAENTIDFFGDDGIDVVGSNVTVKNNIITNNLNINDGNHNDGIQGWTAGGKTNRNVIISGNLVVNSVVTLPFPGSMQGISIFDGAWKNIRITDNIVVSNLWHGIALYASVSLSDATVTNNVVIAGDNAHCQTWLGIFRGSSGIAPTNVLVTDNLVSNLKIATTGVTASQNHRIVNNAKALQAVFDLYKSGHTASYANFLPLVAGNYR